MTALTPQDARHLAALFGVAVAQRQRVVIERTNADLCAFLTTVAASERTAVIDELLAICVNTFTKCRSAQRPREDVE